MLESMAYDKNFWSYDPECRSITRNKEFSLLPLWSKSVSTTVLYFRPCFPVQVVYCLLMILAIDDLRVKRCSLLLCGQRVVGTYF